MSSEKTENICLCPQADRTKWTTQETKLMTVKECVGDRQHYAVV